MKKYDYSQPNTLYKQTMTTLGGGDVEKETGLIAGVKQLAGGLLENSIIGKMMSIGNASAASANAILLREKGYIDEADKIDAQVIAYAKEKGISGFPEAWRSGTGKAEAASEINQSNISKWGTSAGASSVTPEMTAAGVEYAAKGDDRADTWEGQKTSVGGVTINKNQTSPISSSNDDSSQSLSDMVKEHDDARSRAKDAADRLGVGLATGGRATGGLVDRRVKLKPTPTPKAKKNNKKGLGRK